MAQQYSTHSQILRDAQDVKTRGILEAANELARRAPRDVSIVAGSLETQGSRASKSGISIEAKTFLTAILELGATDAEYASLGRAMQAPHTTKRFAEMDVKGRVRDLSGLDPIVVLTDCLVYKDSAEAIIPPQDLRASMRAASVRLEEHTQYDDARERPPAAAMKNANGVRLFICVLFLVAVVYFVLRLADIGNLYSHDKKGGYVVYRLVIFFIELFYLISALYVLIARTKHRAPATFDAVADASQTFNPLEIITILMCTDENADAISAAVESHYQARRPEKMPIKVVVLTEQETDGVKNSIVALRSRFRGISLMTYEQLANQAIVVDPNAGTGQLGDQAVEGVVVANDMTPGQALYYALHALTRVHNTRFAAVCVMDASCTIDLDHYYDYAIRSLRQPAVYAVSMPIRAKNLSSVGDFFDMSRNVDKWVRVPGLLADGKVAVNSKCFVARGYSIYKMLRRMEVRSVQSTSLDWLMYLIKDNQTAAVGVYEPDRAPMSTYLGHINGQQILQGTITETLESLDVSSVLNREAGTRCCSFKLFQPLSAPHMAAVAAVWFEFMILFLVLVTVFGQIVPASTDNWPLGLFFIIHYLLIVLATMLTAYGFKGSLVGTTLRNRVMAPVHWVLYLANFSRFGVDRRGHFKASGETTTVQLDENRRRPKQRAEAETTAINFGAPQAEGTLGGPDDACLDIVIDSPTAAPRAWGPGGGPICEGRESHGTNGYPKRTGDVSPRATLHKGLMGVGYFTAILIVILAIIAFIKGWTLLQGKRAPNNYTTAEIAAARGWVVAAMALCIFIIIPATIFLVTISKGGALIRNRAAGLVLLLLSLIALLIPGVIQFVASAILTNRDDLLDLAKLQTASNFYLASQAAGADVPNFGVPWRGASDIGAKNISDLSGGWYTGPGFSKFTYPQAIAVTDIAMALIAFPDELSKMGAGETLQIQLLHGVEHLLATHDRASQSVVAYMYESDPPPALSPTFDSIDAQWTRPESDTRSISNMQYVRANSKVGGTETFSTVAAAFAASAIYLNRAGSNPSLASELQARAVELYTLASASALSYTALSPNANYLWPSNENSLADDQLWAATWLAFLTQDQQYTDDIEALYTKAEQERSAGGRTDGRLEIDDYWWASNFVLAVSNGAPRYLEACRAFMAAWTQKKGTLTVAKVGENDDGLAYWGDRTGSYFWDSIEFDTRRPKLYLTPGPAPFALRAMSYILWFTTASVTETEDDRDAVCYAQGQLRHILGVNKNKVSYAVGLNLYETDRSIKQPYDRASSCQPDITAICDIQDYDSQGPNPSVLLGALVNGPNKANVFEDRRSAPASTGTGILNNSPLALVTAGLYKKDLKIKDCVGYEKLGLQDSPLSKSS